MTDHSRATRSRSRAGKRIGAIACAAAVSLSVTLPLSAHHSFSAEFDGTRDIKITGNVTDVEWQNPHAWIHLSVQELCERPGTGNRRGGENEEPWNCTTTDADAPVEWGFELASPNGLMRQGWTRNSLKLGDHVTIEGSRARDDSPNGNARIVTTASGKRLFAGSSQGTTP